MSVPIGYTVFFISILLLAVLWFLVKGRVVKWIILAISIPLAMAYAGAIYRAPNHFRGTCIQVEDLTVLPDNTWVLSFTTDRKTYIALWVLIDDEPIAYSIPWDEDFMKKMDKAKKQQEKNSGFMRLRTTGKKGRNNGTEDKESIRVEVVDPKEGLKKNE